MLRVLICAFVVACICCATSVSANEWSAQDDFTLIFGTPGNPGSAGGSFTAKGRLLQWSSNTIAGWWTLGGTTSAGAQSTATQWVTTYDSGSTLKIYSDKMNTNLIWQGSGYVYTAVEKSGATFDASLFDRPAYETIPSEFLGVGGGQFARTSGSWLYHAMNVDWLGSYNWNYDGQTIPESTLQTGNCQAKITAIPEATTVMLGLMGLSSVAGFRKLRRR